MWNNLYKILPSKHTKVLSTKHKETDVNCKYKNETERRQMENHGYSG